nr:Chain A, PrP peptide [synthetic construct]4W5M_B Chain B, PrP peptide [synthetic construct]
GGYMLGS